MEYYNLELFLNQIHILHTSFQLNIYFTYYYMLYYKIGVTTYYM